MLHVASFRASAIVCALTIASTAVPSPLLAVDARWTGDDDDWFAEPSQWQDLSNGSTVAPPASASNPTGAAYIGSGTARIFGSTAPSSPLVVNGLRIGASGGQAGATAVVVSEIGLDGGFTSVGDAAAGTVAAGLTIESGGLGSRSLEVGIAYNQGFVNPVSVTGTADISGGVSVTADPYRNVIVGQSRAQSAAAASGTGYLLVRTGDLLAGRLNVGDAESSAGAANSGVTATADGEVKVLAGNIGSSATPLTALSVGNIWVSARRGAEAVGRVSVVGDLHFNNAGGSIVLASSSMWADPINPGLGARTAQGALTVGGTAYLRGSGLTIGGGVGFDSNFHGMVDVAVADIVVNGTQLGFTAGSSRDHTVHGELYLREGVASLGAIRIGIDSGATRTSASGLLAMGSVTSGTSLAVGDGAELRFLLRDGGESGDLTLTGAAATTLDGDLTLDVLAGETLGVGDAITLLQTSAGFAAGSSFDNVVSGGILSSLDGDHTFSVHYGPGSLYDDNAVVAVVTSIVPEPAAAGLLLILGVAAICGRPR